MPFDERLKNTQTPSRVYALCRLVGYKTLTKEQLRLYLFPPKLNNNKDDVFNNVYDFAKAGELIDDADEKVRLKLSDKDIETPTGFRKAIANRTFSNPQRNFCRFTAWYIMRGSKVYTENTKDWMGEFDREINVDKSLNIYNDTNLNGWRTWAAFLGFGFIHRGVLIPNVAIRLQDLIEEDKTFSKGGTLLFADFIEWLNKMGPELDYGPMCIANRGAANIESQHLSLGLSAGLRSLHDRGLVKLEYTRDAADVWYLTESPHHAIPNQISEITIGGFR